MLLEFQDEFKRSIRSSIYHRKYRQILSRGAPIQLYTYQSVLCNSGNIELVQQIVLAALVQFVEHVNFIAE